MSASAIPDPNRRTQQRIWVVARVSWALLAVFLLWGLAGGAGTGLLASQRLESEKVSLSYDRFARRGAATEMTLTWKDAPQPELVVSLDSAFVDAMRIDFAGRGVIPTRSDNRILLRISTAGSGGSLRFEAHPLRAGRKTTSLQIDGVEIGRISMLVFP
jgi:hypothetical protein